MHSCNKVYCCVDILVQEYFKLKFHFETERTGNRTFIVLVKRYELKILTQHTEKYIYNLPKKEKF